MSATGEEGRFCFGGPCPCTQAHRHTYRRGSGRTTRWERGGCSNSTNSQPPCNRGLLLSADGCCCFRGTTTCIYMKQVYVDLCWHKALPDNNDVGLANYAQNGMQEGVNYTCPECFWAAGEGCDRQNAATRIAYTSPASASYTWTRRLLVYTCDTHATKCQPARTITCEKVNICLTQPRAALAATCTSQHNTADRFAINKEKAGL